MVKNMSENDLDLKTEHDHDHDHDHDHEHDGGVEYDLAHVATGAEKSDKVADGVEDAVWLCAERGWRVSLEFRSGEELKGVFITATDEARKFIVVERAGERQKKPRLVDLRDVRMAEAIWKES